MKKNKYIHYLIFILILLIISFSIEFIVYQLPLLTLDSSQKGIITINNYNNLEDENNRIINIQLNNKYINKLRINYISQKDIPYTIQYEENDYYNNIKESSINDIFDNEVSEAIVNIRNNVDSINILYNKDSDVIINDIYILNQISFNYFRIIFFFFSLSLISVIYYFYKNNIKTSNIHNLFFIVGLIIGSLMIIVQPSATYYSWDDQIHFKNIKEISGGDIEWNIGEFSMIDSSPVGRLSINSIDEQINQMKYLNKKQKGNYMSYGGRFITYNKIAYIPAALGYHICKKIGLPFVICFKFGKFMNLFVYLLIIRYAIKITKIGKRLLTVISLIPINIFLASQYSYDPSVTSSLILALVILINWYVDKDDKVTFNKMLLFLASMLYGCFTKGVYIPFILLFLFIPKERFYNKKHSIILKSGIVILCLLVMSTFVLPTVSSDNIAGDTRGGATSVSEQIKIIVNHPIGYIKLLSNTMGKQFANNFLSKGALLSFSYIYSFQDNEIGSNLYYILIILLLFVTFTDNNQYELNLRQRLIGIILSLGIIVLIWTALYLSFTPVGENSINGVQSRYFLPIMYFLIICLKSNKIVSKIDEKKYNLTIVSVSCLILLIEIYNFIIVSYCL